MKIEAIAIDKDGEEALRYLAELVDRFTPHLGHGRGPKAAEGPPGTVDRSFSKETEVEAERLSGPPPFGPTPEDAPKTKPKSGADAGFI